MDFQDLFITPIYACIMFLFLYVIRKSHTNPLTRPYYLNAFFVKAVGAVFVGLLYYFYYGGGDTTIYYRDASYIYDAFFDSPILWFKLLLSKNEYDAGLYQYTSRIYYFVDPHSRPIVKLTGFFSIFTFNTYSTIALWYALISFFGVWAAFKVLVDICPPLHKSFAVSLFFVPSVFFWGSGVLKDAVTLAALFFAFNAFYFGMIKRQKIIKNVVIFFIACYVLQLVKMYILMSFLVPMFLWLFLQYRSKIKSKVLRAIILPFLLAISIPVGLFSITKLTAGTRYSLEQIGETTKTTSDWLQHMNEVSGGDSGYYLGEMDGSIESMLALSGPAIWVSLFRPHPWEVKNVVMLLEAVESLLMLLFTIKVLIQCRFKVIGPMLANPLLAFCFVFVLVLAIGVGLNSSNFGTLSRYRIPLIPFYMTGLYLLRYQVNKSTKLF